MKNIITFITILLIYIFFSSCQKEFLNPDIPVPPTPVVFDTDAQRFIDSSGIADSTVKLAIHSFVKELKDSSLWTKFMAIYPMAGGTATTMKWNLKDPRDLDVAYRATFIGSPAFSGTGVLFTAGSWGDTHLSDNLLTYNDAAISYYSRTQNSSTGYDIGCSDSIPPYNELSIGQYSEWFGLNDTNTHPITKGLFLLSSSTNDVKRYENGKPVLSLGYAPGDTATNSNFLLGVSKTGLQGFRECALATIGYGLTDSQALTFYNIVQNFETSLGR